MSYVKDLAAALAQWRDAERQMQAAPTGSDEAERLTRETERLRSAHARLTATAGMTTSASKRELAERSDDMLDELAHLKDAELRKREEPISTPPFHALEEEVSASSRRIFKLGAEEAELGRASTTGDESILDIERTG